MPDRAIIRPSWPAPTMPMRMGDLAGGWIGLREDLGGLALAEGRERVAEAAGACAARIAAASSAAFRAPGSPIATVATGTPAGICAIESSESRPFSAFDWIGTPITGSSVFDAVMPGRCAAPPAPAMMHLEAARCGAAGVFEQQVRRAMRGDDAALERHGKRRQHVGGVAHRLPVGGRAHDDADQRFHRGILACARRRGSAVTHCPGSNS